MVDKGTVECLGMTFESDEERREYFLEKLCEMFKDPKLRKIEGISIGKDEDILALSNPNYYTSSFIKDFIKQYSNPNDPIAPYSREPFTTDVSKGKKTRYIKLIPIVQRSRARSPCGLSCIYNDPGNPPSSPWPASVRIRFFRETPNSSCGMTKL